MSLSRKLRFVSVFLRANGRGKGGTLHITQAVINARPPCLSGSSELQRGDDQPLDQDRKYLLSPCNPWLCSSDCCPISNSFSPCPTRFLGEKRALATGKGNRHRK